MKSILFILAIIISLYSCSEYKKFTVYKIKPFDTSNKNICFDKIYTIKHFFKNYPDYLQYNQFIFHSNGVFGTCHIDENIEYIQGHYIIRADTIYLQRFGFDAGGTYKKYLIEDFAKIINDSTIIFYYHRCNFCYKQFSGYRESPDIYFDPPIEFNVTSTSNKSEEVSGWFLKKKWYKKNVWNNNQ